MKAYADENGVKDSERNIEQSAIYDTEEYLIADKMRQLFSLSSKMFIIISMFISALFVTGIKTLFDIPIYQRRYEFFDCMGMRMKKQHKNIRFEVRSLANISLIAGFIMAGIYVVLYMKRQYETGTVIGPVFLKYWFILIAGYIIFEFIIQRFLISYVIHKVKREAVS